MILGTNRRSAHITLPLTPTLNTTTIDLVKSYNYLGVNLNGQLNFTGHIQQTIGHAAFKINTVAYLKKMYSK